VNHLSTRRKRKQASDSVSSGERKPKSLNLESVKPAGLAFGGSWDSLTAIGRLLGKLQSQSLAEEFWKTPPKSIIAAYAKAVDLPGEHPSKAGYEEPCLN
jgi:hypothetical protein